MKTGINHCLREVRLFLAPFLSLFQKLGKFLWNLDTENSPITLCHDDDAPPITWK